MLSVENAAEAVKLEAGAALDQIARSSVCEDQTPAEPKGEHVVMTRSDRPGVSYVCWSWFDQPAWLRVVGRSSTRTVPRTMPTEDHLVAEGWDDSLSRHDDGKVRPPVDLVTPKVALR